MCEFFMSQTACRRDGALRGDLLREALQRWAEGLALLCFGTSAQRSFLFFVLHRGGGLELHVCIWHIPLDMKT